MIKFNIKRNLTNTKILSYVLLFQINTKFSFSLYKCKHVTKQHFLVHV